MTTDAEARSAWPRNGEVIRREELLRLIEQNGGPEGLDLRGAILGRDEPSIHGLPRPVDLSPQALVPLVEAYRQANGGASPPWLASTGGIALDGGLLQGATLLFARLEKASLTDARLQGADLSMADLQNANLTRGQLEDAYLEGASLAEVNLQWAQLRRAVLAGALLEAANLDEADLEEADLEAVDFEGADLRGARLPAVSLPDANLRGAKLWEARLERADLYQVASADGAHWSGALLDHTRIKRESLGKAIGDELDARREKAPWAYHEAKEAYLLLKNNFNQIGRYEDASWAYVKEQQMEKMAYHWEWRSHGWKMWRAWGSFWRWLRNWAYELATGYGERPWNPVIGGLLAILAFAGGFCATRAVANFWDALIYSLATFATFNLADTGPTGRGADVASSVEALLGIAVLALVVFTLGNKMSRG